MNAIRCLLWCSIWEYPKMKVTTLETGDNSSRFSGLGYLQIHIKISEINCRWLVPEITNLLNYHRKSINYNGCWTKISY